MKKPITFVLQSELYPHKVIVFIGPRPKPETVGGLCKRHKLWSGEGRTPHTGDGRASTITFGCGCFLWMEVFDGKASPDWFGTLAHEMCHVLSNASEHMGIYMDQKTDEFHAYYGGWLTKQIVRRMQRRR